MSSLTVGSFLILHSAYSALSFESSDIALESILGLALVGIGLIGNASFLPTELFNELRAQSRTAFETRPSYLV